MRRLYVGASWLFIVGGAVLFVGGMIETALSQDRSLREFILVGILCGLTVGLGFAFRVLAAARDPDGHVAVRWTEPSSPVMGRWFRRIVVTLIGVAITAAGMKGALDGDITGVGVALIGIIVAAIGATGRWSALWELLQPY